MIAVTAQTRIWVAREPADFRCGIDGLAKICRTILKSDPFSGALFVFSKSEIEVDQDPCLQRPRILALPKAAVEGTIPMVA